MKKIIFLILLALLAGCATMPAVEPETIGPCSCIYDETDTRITQVICGPIDKPCYFIIEDCKWSND